MTLHNRRVQIIMGGCSPSLCSTYHISLAGAMRERLLQHPAQMMKELFYLCFDLLAGGQVVGRTRLQAGCWGQVD